MYYQNYEDYMGNMVGYQPMNSNMYSNYHMHHQMEEMKTEEISEMYPDIYKIIYPVICKVCTQNMHRPITRDLILKLTDEVYEIVEDDRTQADTAVRVEETRKEVNQQPSTSKSTSTTSVSNTRSEETTILHSRNTFLKDLIRILVIRELFPRPRPPRPPFPGPGPMPRPPRPPFPGPGPMPRPPRGSESMYMDHTMGFQDQNAYMNSLYQDDIYQF